MSYSRESGVNRGLNGIWKRWTTLVDGKKPAPGGSETGYVIGEIATAFASVLFVSTIFLCAGAIERKLFTELMGKVNISNLIGNILHPLLTNPRNRALFHPMRRPALTGYVKYGTDSFITGISPTTMLQVERFSKKFSNLLPVPSHLLGHILKRRLCGTTSNPMGKTVLD